MSLAGFAASWFAFPSAMGSADIFEVNLDGSATLDTNDGAHLVLVVTASSQTTATARVTTSSDGVFTAIPAGTVLALRKGSGTGPGLYVTGAPGELPVQWCTSGPNQCDAGELDNQS